jgi:hypothetical protein
MKLCLQIWPTGYNVKGSSSTEAGGISATVFSTLKTVRTVLRDLDGNCKKREKGAGDLDLVKMGPDSDWTRETKICESQAHRIYILCPV